MKGSLVGSLLVFGQWDLIRLFFPFLYAPIFKFSYKVTSIFILSSFYKCSNLRGIFYSDLERTQLGMDVSPVSLLSLLWDGCHSGVLSTHFSPMRLPSLFPLLFPSSMVFLFLGYIEDLLLSLQFLWLHYPLPDLGVNVRLHLFFSSS